SPSTPGRPRPPGAPPASVLFFKALQALVQFLTGHRQERLLQRQCHMRIGQRFFDSSQFAAELGGLVYFMSFFHSNDFTIPATSPLPYPAHHCPPALDAVFSLHGRSTELPGFYFPDSLHFEAITVSNYFHGAWFLCFQVPIYFRTGPPERTPESERWLLLRNDANCQIKYALSNAPQETTMRE